jgi:hypothetical protein
MGSLGIQVVATKYFAAREDWRNGDRVEVDAWAAYRLTLFFSASARMHAETFEAIEGFDETLIPSRDPGEWETSFAGTRVDIPLGLNIFLPEGRFAGHRLSVEFLFPVYERFDGPWLANDGGVTIGWQKSF